MQIDDIAHHFESLRKVFALVAKDRAEGILDCCRLLTTALRDGRKVLIMGNGGSAADAQHFAAELVGRFLLERKALPAIALTTDSSILTAVGNDYGFDEIFRRQVEALAQAGDVVIGISTSGMSNNVFHALTEANAIGCKTVGLLGRSGGNIAGIVDVDLTVPVQETPLIQAAHGAIIHILCDLVEKSCSDEAGSWLR
ncbi:MAG: D-sedoheptulose 7-phosphate isomerase [Syntrophotaleaceae bacterium]